MYSRTHARTHNRATSQGNEKKTDKNPTKQNTEPFFAFKGYISILLQTFLAIQLRFTTQYPFHPLRFPHTIDLRVYQAWFRLDHRSKDSSMISLFNFVCSCPFVTNELLRWRGLYRCAVCAVYLPSLRGGLLIISGGIVCSYEGERSREKGTVSWLCGFRGTSNRYKGWN